MAAILNFQVTTLIFPISDPRCIFMPILVLVSQFERLFHLFAPLGGKRQILNFGVGLALMAFLTLSLQLQQFITTQIKA